MKNPQQAVLSALLDALCARKLISESTCSAARNLVCSAGELPDFFRRPAEAPGREPDGGA